MSVTFALEYSFRCIPLITFFRPTVLDAVVYGCLEAILTNGPSVLLDTLTARGSENLLKYCENSVSAQRKGLQFITYPSTQNLSNLH